MPEPVPAVWRKIPGALPGVVRGLSEVFEKMAVFAAQGSFGGRRSGGNVLEGFQRRAYFVFFRGPAQTGPTIDCASGFFEVRCRFLQQAIALGAGARPRRLPSLSYPPLPPLSRESWERPRTRRSANRRPVDSMTREKIRSLEPDSFSGLGRHFEDSPGGVTSLAIGVRSGGQHPARWGAEGWNFFCYFGL